MPHLVRVIDTSAWIEWLIDGPLRKKLTKEIPDKAECIVPTIVQLELAKWLAREVGDDQADQMIAYTQKCVVAPLDTRTALRKLRRDQPARESFLDRSSLAGFVLGLQ